MVPHFYRLAISRSSSSHISVFVEQSTANMVQQILSPSHSSNDDVQKEERTSGDTSTTRHESYTDQQQPIQNDQKIAITEEQCTGELGYSFPNAKKWRIIMVIFIVQISMNFNASLYSNAVHGISERYEVSAQAARVGAAVFLVAYAFG